MIKYLFLAIYLFNQTVAFTENFIEKKISENGSARATAYYVSNKIIERANNLYVTYLDYEKENFVIKVSSFDKFNLDLSKTINISKNVNNDHSGANILIDKNQKLHIFYGSNAPLNYISLADLSLETIHASRQIKNVVADYPTGVINQNNEILTIFRNNRGSIKSNSLWEYNILKIADGKIKSQKKLITGNIFKQPLKDMYLNFHAQLAISPDNRVHLSFLFHERPKKDHLKLSVSRGIGYGIFYLYSDDFGETWNDIENNQVNLPIEVKKEQFLVSQDDFSIPDKHYIKHSMTINPLTSKPIYSYTLINRINEKFEVWMGEIVEDKFVSTQIPYTAAMTSIFVDIQGSTYLALENFDPSKVSVSDDWWGNPYLSIKVLKKNNDNNDFEEIYSKKNDKKPLWLSRFPHYVSSDNLPQNPYLIFTEGADLEKNNVYLLKLK